MNNKLTLLLLADDKISPILQQKPNVWRAQARRAADDIQRPLTRSFGNIKGRLNELLNTPITFGNAPNSASGNGGMLGAVLFGNLGAAGVMAGLDAVRGGIQGIKNSLLDAASFETQTLGIASDVGTNLGLDLDSAVRMQERTQKEIANLAAILPGVTADYTNILNGIAPSISRAFQGNVEGYQNTILDITKRVGVLAAKGQADPSMAGSGINRFISGTTGFQEVMTIDIFQKNSMFQQALRDGLANLGASTEDWKDLTTEQRLAITQNALKVATPDSLLEAFNGTAEASIQEMQTKLFDPMLGLFGVMRDTADGRSALDSFSEFLGNFLGLSEAVGDTLARYGITADPMAGVVKFFDWASKLSKGAEAIISSGLTLGGFDLSGLFTNRFSANLGTLLGNAVNRLGEHVASLDWSTIATRFFEFSWTALGWLGSQVVQFVQTVDWIGLLKGYAEAGAIFLGTMILEGLTAIATGLLEWLGFIETESTDKFSRLADGLENWFQAFQQGLAELGQRLLQHLKEVALDAIVPTPNFPGVPSLPDMVQGAAGFVGGFLPGADRATEGDTELQTGPDTAPKELRSAAPMSQTTNNNGGTFAPVMHISSNASDPKTVADEVFRKLADAYGQSKQNRLGVVM